MAEISTRLLLDGVTLALRAAFPTAQIEADSVEQALSPPAFLALPAEVSLKAYPGGRWLRESRVETLYFPPARDPDHPQTGGRLDCLAVGDALFDALEAIALPGGDSIRGSELHFEIVEGVLHFHACYKAFVRRAETAAAKMESLTLQESVRTMGSLELGEL